MNTGFPDFIQQAAQAAQNVAQAAQNVKLRIEFEQLLEERKNQCFKIFHFLKLYQKLEQAKEKQQLNDEDRELLDSVGTILNDYLDMLKEIKGE